MGVKSRICIGQTGRSVHSRAIEHEAGVRRKEKKSALYKHMREHHDQDDQPSFSMKIISRHKTNLDRLITEGISIEKVREKDPESLMNSRAEWGRTKLVRHSTNTTFY